MAGCIRAVKSEQVINELLSTRSFVKALTNSVATYCYEIVSVPQLQNYLDRRFNGYSSSDELELSHTGRSIMFGFFHQLALAVLLPFIAVWPPLADNCKALRYTPALRYRLYEYSCVAYFVTIALTSLNLYRDPPNFARDWGLLVWSVMLVSAQCQHISVAGVDNFLLDKANVVDLVASLGSLTGFMLNVCHGHDHITPTLFSICEQWPQTVPTAAWELLSLSTLLHGLRCTRILTLHPRFGPLILSVIYMTKDVVDWFVIVAFPILAFAGALHILYGDGFRDPAIEMPDECIDPDVDFENVPHGLELLVEMMLVGEGHFACFRASQHFLMGSMYSYAFLLVSTIMLVNVLIALMAKTLDGFTENLVKQFLFCKTRIICNWLLYPAIPPPFSFLSLPYYLIQGCLSLLAYLCSSCKCLSSTRARIMRLKQQLTGSRRLLPQDCALPQRWLQSVGDDPMLYLVEEIVHFKLTQENRDMQRDDFKEALFAELRELRTQLAEMQSLRTDMKELHEDFQEQKAKTSQALTKVVGSLTKAVGRRASPWLPQNGTSSEEPASNAKAQFPPDQPQPESPLMDDAPLVGLTDQARRGGLQDDNKPGLARVHPEEQQEWGGYPSSSDTPAHGNTPVGSRVSSEAPVGSSTPCVPDAKRETGKCSRATARPKSARIAARRASIPNVSSHLAVKLINKSFW